MIEKTCTCGRKKKRLPADQGRNLSKTELLAPHRLVALLTTRPELSGVGLVRLAEATLECA